MQNLRLGPSRWSALLILAGLLLIPRNVDALATGTSEISFSNLRIVSAAGTIQFVDPWVAQAFAQASNSLGQRDQQFGSSVGGVADANAMVTFADGHATAAADMRTGNAASNVNIPGGVAQASSAGLGTLFNSFLITGGTGLTTVTFSVDITGLLHVFTDDSGLRARTRTIFALELDGAVILFHDLFLDVGPDSDSTLPFTRTLFATLILPFNTPFFILAQADSESLAANIPEPSTITLMLIGLGVLGGLVRRRRRPSA